MTALSHTTQLSSTTLRIMKEWKKKLESIFQLHVVNSMTDLSSTTTPFIKTLSDIRTFSIIWQFRPSTEFFKDVFSAITVPSPTAHSTICVVLMVQLGEINDGLFPSSNNWVQILKIFKKTRFCYLQRVSQNDIERIPSGWLHNNSVSCWLVYQTYRMAISLHNIWLYRHCMHVYLACPCIKSYCPLFPLIQIV